MFLNYQQIKISGLVFSLTVALAGMSLVPTTVKAVVIPSLHVTQARLAQLSAGLTSSDKLVTHTLVIPFSREPLPALSRMMKPVLYPTVLLELARLERFRLALGRQITTLEAQLHWERQWVPAPEFKYWQAEREAQLLQGLLSESRALERQAQELRASLAVKNADFVGDLR